MKHYRSRLVTIIGLVVLTGCTRSAEEPFVLRESISSLPELHQENIRDGLRRMFGTPSRPRLLVMNDEPAEEDADAPSTAATPDETVVAGLIDPDRLVHGRRCISIAVQVATASAATGKGKRRHTSYRSRATTVKRSISLPPRLTGIARQGRTWCAPFAAGRRARRCPLFSGYPRKISMR